MAKDEAVLPGQGWVFYGAPDTAPFEISTFDEKTLTDHEGWTFMGNTSKENLPTLGKEGGDITTYETWDTPSMRSDVASTVYSMTINVVSMTVATLQLAFPGGTWDQSSGQYKVAARSQTTNKAVLVVMKDNVNGYQGFYFPNAAIALGDAPELASDGFVEVPLLATAQTSSTSGSPFSWMPPKDLNATPGA
ncbi:MAG: hypothetical protein SPI14_06045 [Arcanobacterium sp.]|nr:hypothetical protein [Arcanobacterium sp.]